MGAPNDKNYIRLKKWELLLLIVLVLFAFAAPYIITQFSFGPSFEHTGEIGDTIGGLTAPFINLAAAFLVYKSFTAQIQANLDQRRNHNEQMNDIRKEQYLSTLIFLFSDIEKTIKREESKVSRGCINQIIHLVGQYNSGNIGNSLEYEFYIGDHIENTNKDLRQILLVLNANLIHLRRLTTQISRYSQTFPNDRDVSSIAEYFAHKVNDYLIEFRYIRLGSPGFISDINNFDLNVSNEKFYDEARNRLSDLQYQIKQILEKEGLV